MSFLFDYNKLICINDAAIELNNVLLPQHYIDMNDFDDHIWNPYYKEFYNKHLSTKFSIKKYPAWIFYLSYVKFDGTIHLNSGDENGRHSDWHSMKLYENIRNITEL